MTISPDIAAAQAAYKARPWAVRLSASHVSTTQRFHTEGECYDYVFRMAGVVQRDILRARAAGDRTWYAMTLWGWDATAIITPAGDSIPAGYVLLLNDLRSR